MNLEQAKSKKAQLETEVESVRQELYNQSIEKSKLDAQVQNNRIQESRPQQQTTRNQYSCYSY